MKFKFYGILVFILLLGSCGENIALPASEKCQTPQIIPDGGTFTNSVEVILTSVESGVTIYYTLDGSNPSSLNGQTYTNSLIVSANTDIDITLKAVASGNQKSDSDIASAVFYIKIDNGSQTVYSSVQVSNWQSYEENTGFICNMPVKAIFNGEMDSSTFNSNSVRVYQLTASGSNQITGVLSYSNKTLTFFPDTLFSINSTNIVMLDGVRDSSGVPLQVTSHIYVTGRVLKAFSYAPGGGHYYLDPLAYANGYLYVGTCQDGGGGPVFFGNNYFLKLSTNLSLVWSYDMGQMDVVSGPSLDSLGNIYFVALYITGTNQTNMLYSLDDNGNLRWKYPIDFVSKHGWSAYGTAIDTDNSVVVVGQLYWGSITNGDGIAIGISNLSAVYKFNSDGSTRWKTELGNAILMPYPPIIDTVGNIYSLGTTTLTNEDYAQVISLDSNGNVRWKSELLTSQDGLDETAATLAFNADGSALYCVDYDTFYAINTTDGSVNWSYLIPQPSGDYNIVRSGIVVDANGDIYFGAKTDANDLAATYALKPDGSVKWINTNIVSDHYNVPLLGNNGILYYFTENTGLHAVNSTNGAQLWHAIVQKGADVTHSSSVMDENGIIYVGGMRNTTIEPDKGGYIQAFASDSQGLLSNAVWNGYQNGNLNDGRL